MAASVEETAVLIFTLWYLFVQVAERSHTCLQPSSVGVVSEVSV